MTRIYPGEEEKLRLWRAWAWSIETWRLPDGSWRLVGGPGLVDLTVEHPERLTMEQLRGERVI